MLADATRAKQPAMHRIKATSAAIITLATNTRFLIFPSVAENSYVRMRRREGTGESGGGSTRVENNGKIYGTTTDCPRMSSRYWLSTRASLCHTILPPDSFEKRWVIIAVYNCLTLVYSEYTPLKVKFLLHCTVQALLTVSG